MKKPLLQKVGENMGVFTPLTTLSRKKLNGQMFTSTLVPVGLPPISMNSLIIQEFVIRGYTRIMQKCDANTHVILMSTNHLHELMIDTAEYSWPCVNSQLSWHSAAAVRPGTHDMAR